MDRETRIVMVTVAAILVTGALGAYGYFFLMGRQPPAIVTPNTPEQQQVRWPLTNAPAPDEAALRRRVVSIKIENAPAARPQTGLRFADVVYEVVAEGGITRFNALYHSQSPDRVGPVRSARPADIHIVKEYRALFAFSGANVVVLDLIDSSGIDDIPESAGGAAFQRSSQRRPPHNLYADIGELRKVAVQRRFSAEADPPALQFGAVPSSEGATATVAEATFNAANRVRWVWNADAGRWRRELNGKPHADSGTTQAYSAANVVLLFADVLPGPRPGTTDFRLDTSGEAIVYRDGRRIPARWSGGGNEAPRFTTQSGAELPLAAGPTWIEVFSAADRARFR